MNVNMLTFSDDSYPVCLRNIPDPPQALYWAGRNPAEWLNKPKIAIVGSRKFSPYGRAVTQKLASQLAQAGVVIISGLAYGVDITAHQSALASRGIGVAVLPSGLDQIYPASHAGTARQIAETGTLISEYPAGSVSFKVNFIARNRIVSGLADAVLIPEAALKSGSLHTARFAMEQGKPVLAVPGHITSPASEGCNNLIKSGAIPVTTVEDVLFALKINPNMVREQKQFMGTESEETVYSLIKEGVSDQEELSAAAGIGSPAVSSALTMLEISGYIRPIGAGRWIVS